MLKTRLKTVPPYTFSAEQLRRTTSGNPYSQVLLVSEDGHRNQDDNAINFASRLQQFQRMQQQHRIHAKFQLPSHNSASSTLSQDMERSDESRQSSSQRDISRTSSRSSWVNSGQLQQ